MPILFSGVAPIAFLVYSIITAEVYQDYSWVYTLSTIVNVHHLVLSLLSFLILFLLFAGNFCRLYDMPSSELMKHWDKTYAFIKEAK